MLDDDLGKKESFDVLNVSLLNIRLSPAIELLGITTAKCDDDTGRCVSVAITILL